MNKRVIKLISMALVAALAAACAAAAGLSVSAAAGDVIYFDNSVTDYSVPYIYLWGEGVGNNSEWPGEKMTKLSGDIWAYNVQSGYTKVIFSTGSNAHQSNDLDYPVGGKLAKPKSSGSKYDVEWSDYSGSETLPTESSQPTQPVTQSDPPSGSAGTVYCKNDAEWTTVYCYMWNDNPEENNHDWPGEPMTDLGSGVWEYTASKSYANLIFNGNKSPQTGNLTFQGDGYIYNNSTDKWEFYQVGPVTITSFTASLESPSYTGSSITLSAAAKSNAAGVLNYKFTVDSAVISDGKASSVVWIPTNAGTYTICVEATDSKNNTGTRKMTYEVRSEAALEGAYIRGLKNSLNTETQIKKDTAVTFTSDAVGGHTGSGLLFYKFSITEPDGSKNTAYYTTDNTYSYTPSKLGQYTITTSVQNSYNATVSKTYTFTSVNTINESEQTVTTEAEQPTQPTQATQPATQPTQAPQTTEPTAAVTKPAETLPDSKIKGDADGNGILNINDVTTIQIYLIGKGNGIHLDLADYTGDNQVQIQDANMIQRALLFRR